MFYQCVRYSYNVFLTMKAVETQGNDLLIRKITLSLYKLNEQYMFEHFLLLL